MERQTRTHHPDSGIRHARSLARLGLWLCLFLFSGAAAVRAASFSVSLDRDTIMMGDSAVLSLKYEDGGPNNQPLLPNIPNLQITYIGPSSQFSFINGRSTSSVTHNFNVTPRAVGDYTIPALSADVGGQRYTTQPLRLKVIQPGAPSAESVNSGQELAFMKLVLPKNEFYLGETTTAELDLYFRDTIRGVNGFQLMSLPAEGMTVGKPVKGQEQRMQVGSGSYQRIPLTIALTPIKTGTIQLGPITAMAVVQIAGTGGRDPIYERFGIRDPFGDFNAEQRRISLATDLQTVKVLPLPSDNVPPGFNGAVGSYIMTATAGPTNVTAGDPITVKVQIAGRGNLDSLKLPVQDAWQDFKTYPPTSKVDTSDPLGLQGTKTFEQIVIPQNSDIHELPGVTFTYFDPDAKAYKTLTQPGISLLVRPGAATQMPLVAGNTLKPENTPPPQDIVPIKQRLGRVAQAGPPLVTRSWFLAAQSAPVLAWLGVLTWRRRTDSLANNPRLRRHRYVAGLVQNGRSELRRHAAGNESDEFFATLFRLLQEVVGEHLDCPANAITEAVVEERLRPAGVPEATRAALHELFQLCNLARYAPVRSSQELAAIIPKFETVVHDLEGVKA